MKKQPYSALSVPAVARKCCTLTRATISCDLCAPAGTCTCCGMSGMIFSLGNARFRVLRCSRLLVSGAVLSPPLPWLTLRTLALLFLCLRTASRQQRALASAAHVGASLSSFPLSSLSLSPRLLAPVLARACVAALGASRTTETHSFLSAPVPCRVGLAHLKTCQCFCVFCVSVATLLLPQLRQR
jgi:hypothetical protein